MILEEFQKHFERMKRNENIFVKLCKDNKIKI